MNRDDSRLMRHLATAVAVKLVLLAVLWWAFVHDGAVRAGSEQMAAHLAAPATPWAARQPIAPAKQRERPLQSAGEPTPRVLNQSL